MLDQETLAELLPILEAIGALTVTRVSDTEVHLRAGPRLLALLMKHGVTPESFREQFPPII